jgi:hypothetical protein
MIKTFQEGKHTLTPLHSITTYHASALLCDKAPDSATDVSFVQWLVAFHTAWSGEKVLTSTAADRYASAPPLSLTDLSSTRAGFSSLLSH